MNLQVWLYSAPLVLMLVAVIWLLITTTSFYGRVKRRPALETCLVMAWIIGFSISIGYFFGTPPLGANIVMPDGTTVQDYLLWERRTGFLGPLIGTPSFKVGVTIGFSMFVCLTVGYFLAKFGGE